MRRAVRRSVPVALLTSLVLATTGGCGADGDQGTAPVPPTPAVSDAPAPESPSSAPAPSERSGSGGGDGGRAAARPGPPRVVETVATGLEAPWGLAFFPNGDALVTERDSTRVLRVSGDERVVREVGTLDAAAPEGEGGLLGVAISPDYPEDRDVWFYLTTATDNRIVRATLEGDVLGTPQVVLDGIPKGFIHDGGRLAFGPDGYLYASTGETGDPALAQDRGSLAGKVLRLTPEGDPAPGNPFGSPVWTWGHRNVQGLAFDDRDRLWASEFGDATADELNLLEQGANYGWPQVEGAGGRESRTGGFVDPRRTWSPEVASPAGLAYADDALWMGALRGERLWRIPVEGGEAGRPEALFTSEYGRLRTVVTAPDGSLWVTTSNRDGRGVPAAEDDRILRVVP